MAQIWDFSFKSLQGKDVNLADYKGKALLLVNTASKCGFTPQYEGLQELHETYGDQGLTIIGFPCNQFGGQEPGGPEEIEGSCLVNYGVNFLISEKMDVKGKDAHPLFRYVSQALPGLLGKGIKWNFTKFLFGRDGTPIKRFATQTKPKALIPKIESALAEK